MTSNNIWKTAEFVTEWDKNDLRYKLYTVPREAIDEDSDETSNAILVHGIDSGNVRRVDELLDPAYGRMDGEQIAFIDELIYDDATPAEAVAFLVDVKEEVHNG